MCVCVCVCACVRACVCVCACLSGCEWTVYTIRDNSDDDNNTNPYAGCGDICHAITLWPSLAVMTKYNDIENMNDDNNNIPVISLHDNNNTDRCVWSGHQIQETPAAAHHLHGRKHQDPVGRLSHHGPRVVPAAVGQDWSA